MIRLEELPGHPTEAQDTPRRVCFVCTGNTCRSPMAEAVANAWAQERGRRDLRAYSAGLSALEGDPIARHAKEALEKRGIEPVKGRDFREHTAHSLRADEVEQYDLLAGMPHAHVMQLSMYFPHAADRIVRMPTPVSDPFGGDAALYASTLEQIERGVKELLFSEDPT